MIKNEAKTNGMYIKVVRWEKGSCVASMYDSYLNTITPITLKEFTPETAEGMPTIHLFSPAYHIPNELGFTVETSELENGYHYRIRGEIKTDCLIFPCYSAQPYIFRAGRYDFTTFANPQDWSGWFND